MCISDAYEWCAVTFTDVLGQKDHKEWRDEVVDALYVAAGRVSDGPDVEDTLKYLKQPATRWTSTQP